MQKIVTLFLLSTLILFGMRYQQLKTKILKESNILKSQNLLLKKTTQNNDILLRRSNPILTIEASNFNQTKGDNSFGYSINTSQTFRRDNYMRGLEDKAMATSLLSHALVSEGKASYIKEIEKLYTNYVYQNRVLLLLKEEYKLSQEVTSMVKQRYKSGSQTRVSYLQAKTQTTTIKTQMFSIKQKITTLYYQLTALAGITQKISLEKNFIYAISPSIKKSHKLSPQEKILQAKENIYKSEYRINEDSFQKYQLYGGMEQEPDQAILRFGVTIPLPLFNDKTQERSLAKLKKEENMLKQKQLTVVIHSVKERIKYSLTALFEQYSSLKNLRNEQQELSSLLHRGYKISRGSLFQLMTAKNSLIQTKKALLQTTQQINLQKIELHFLQGDYND